MSAAKETAAIFILEQDGSCSSFVFSEHGRQTAFFSLGTHNV